MEASEGQTVDIVSLRKAGTRFPDIILSSYTKGKHSMDKQVQSIIDAGHGSDTSFRPSDQIRRQAEEALSQFRDIDSRFMAMASKTDTWTVESAQTMAADMLAFESEVDSASSGLTAVIAAYKAARKAAGRARAIQKHADNRRRTDRARPYTLNGITGGWRTILFKVAIITVDVENPSEDEPRDYKASTPSSDANMPDWARPHWWYGDEELDAEFIGSPCPPTCTIQLSLDP